MPACTPSCATSTRCAYATAPSPDGYINYVVGANIGGFLKVANAMLAQGCV